MKHLFAHSILLLVIATPFCHSKESGSAGYETEFDIPYCVVDGKRLTMNVFLPKKKEPTAAMVEIHGGWWTVGEPITSLRHIDPVFSRKGIAIFAIRYRLGAEGGFPQNIRDCRNAVRFIRKNAVRFNIDPERIGCMGGSAGSHLSMMLAMVPEDFEDGGPSEGLKDISAKVCNAFSFVGPTDFVRQWNEAVDGAENDAKKYHRVLFKGIEPDTDPHKALYLKMSPAGHVRKDVAPLLIVDGEIDPVVPHLHGKGLHDKLQAVGAVSTYYLMRGQGHVYPGGSEFQKVLENFLVRTLKLDDGK